MAGHGASRIIVSGPPDLLDHFDEVINRLGRTRSKAIQIAMRDFRTDYRWKVEEGDVVVGARNTIYDHETGDVAEAITDIQHRYRGMISSTTRIHLDKRNCLGIVAVEGLEFTGMMTCLFRVEEFDSDLFSLEVQSHLFSLGQRG